MKLRWLVRPFGGERLTLDDYDPLAHLHLTTGHSLTLHTKWGHVEASVAHRVREDFYMQGRLATLLPPTLEHGHFDPLTAAVEANAFLSIIGDFEQLLLAWRENEANYDAVRAAAAALSTLTQDEWQAMAQAEDHQRRTAV